MFDCYRCIIVLLCVSCCWGVGPAAAQCEPPRYALDDAQHTSLDAALKQLIRETRIGLVYEPELVEGKQARCDRREGTPERLLRCLLEGTGLTYRQLSSGTYVLERETTAATTSGRVTDAETDAPLAGVNVFIANSTLGGSTDSDGRFEIVSVPPGRHELVATRVGFETSRKALRVERRPLRDLRLALKRTAYEVPEVTVTDEYPREWKRRFQMFKRAILGGSRNSSDCTIKNPYVLDFAKHQDVLTATANAPLIVDNPRLGYHLTYTLKDFYFQENKGQVRFKGEPYFEELTPASEQQRRRWKERRLEAYEGSLQHFLRTLARGTAFEEGFRARLAVPGQMKEIDPSTLVSARPSSFEHALIFAGRMIVTYLNETVGERYSETLGGSSGEHQRSGLRARAARMVFNERGYFNDAYDVNLAGYWSWERLCDRVPYDYEPPSDE